jgi:membrane-bound metal-dependent hydrolase YbcI (DUF457 family)
MVVVSGVAADLDYSSYFAGPAAFLRFHRTALHSLPASAVLACAFAGAFCIWDRKASSKSSRAAVIPSIRFLPALAACAIGIVGHMLLDITTSGGVQLFWPFHERWFALDIAPNLDPWILLLLVAGLFLPHVVSLVSEEIGERKKSARGLRAAVVTLLLMASYLVVRADVHSRAIDLLLSHEYHGRIPLSAGAFPSASEPFQWRGVVVTDDTMEEITVHLTGSARFDPDRSITHFKPLESAALDSGQRSETAQKFLKYAQFPTASVGRLEDGYRFELRDLRFAADNRSPENIFVRVDFNSSLQVVREQNLFASSPNP